MMSALLIADTAKSNFQENETITVELNARDAHTMMDAWAEHDMCGVDIGPPASMAMAAVAFVAGMLRSGNLLAHPYCSRCLGMGHEPNDSSGDFPPCTRCGGKQVEPGADPVPALARVPAVAAVQAYADTNGRPEP